MRTFLIVLTFILLVVISGCGDKLIDIKQVTPVPIDPNKISFGEENIDPNIIAQWPQILSIINSPLPDMVDNSQYLPPVGFQGSLGSCTAWASAYYSRSAIANRNWKWDNKSIASPMWLYGMTIQEQGKEYGSGTNIKVAHDILVKYGCNSLADSPYSEDINYRPDLTQKNSWIFKIESYKTIDIKHRDSMKNELRNGNFIVASIKLREDFNYLPSGSTYKGEQSLTGYSHAMCIVGYDNSKNAYKLVNSWDTWWCDSGFCYMDYEAFERDCSLGIVAEEKSTTPPEVPPSPNAVDGQITNAFQFWAVYNYLYFEFEFNQPVKINKIVVTGPDGWSAEQPYDMEYENGNLFYYRKDGYEFLQGNYRLTFYISVNGLEQVISRETYISRSVPAGSVRHSKMLFKTGFKAKSFTEIYGMNNRPCLIKK